MDECSGGCGVSEREDIKMSERMARLEERFDNLEALVVSEFEKFGKKMDNLEEELRKLIVRYENRLTKLETNEGHYVLKTNCELKQKEIELRVSKIEDELHNLQNRIIGEESGKTGLMNHWYIIISVVIGLFMVLDVIFRWKGV